MPGLIESTKTPPNLSRLMGLFLDDARQEGYIKKYICKSFLNCYQLVWAHPKDSCYDDALEEAS